MYRTMYMRLCVYIYVYISNILRSREMESPLRRGHLIRSGGPWEQNTGLWGRVWGLRFRAYRVYNGAAGLIGNTGFWGRVWG